MGYSVSPPCHLTHACLPGVSYQVPGTFYFIAYRRLFSGGELRATDEQARDLSDV